MKPVLVTTQYRGVFFGYLNGEPNKLPAEVSLKNVRNCIYWSSDCGGFLGLAANGPTQGCRIGMMVPELTLFGVTSISPVTDKAAKTWDKAKTYGQ